MTRDDWIILLRSLPGAALLLVGLWAFLALLFAIGGPA